MAGYDDVVAQMQEPKDQPAGGYDDAAAMLRDQADTRRGQTALNLANATTENPDRAAVNRQLAKRYNTIPEVVDKFPEDFRHRMATELARDVLAQSPKLQAHLEDNPHIAPVVHDDIGNMSAIEKAVSERKGWLDSIASMPMEAAKGLGGSFNKAAGSLNLVLGAFPVIADKMVGDAKMSDWWFKNMVEPNLQRQERFTPEQNANFPEKAANVAGSLLGVLSQISTSGTTAGATAVEAAGVKEAIASAVEHGSKAMLFPALTDAVDTGRKVYAETGDAGAAVKAAQAQYVASTAMGIMPMSAPGGIATRLATGAASGVVVGEENRQLMNWAMPDTMQSSFNFEDMLLSGLTGAVLGIGGPRSPNVMHDAIRQTYLDAAKAEAAQKDFERWGALSELAAASKYRERDPEGFKEYVNRVTEDGNLQDVYVDGVVFAQEAAKAGITMAELRAKMPEVAQQVNESLQTDGYLRIPTADYLTHIAGGKMDEVLLPHLKVDPEGMTNAEGQAYYQKQVEQMAEQAKRVSEEKQANDTWQTSKKAVHDNILGQLNAAGRASPEANRTNAKLYSEMVSTLAQAHDMTPEQFHAEYGQRIVGEGKGELGQNRYTSLYEALLEGGNAERNAIKSNPRTWTPDNEELGVDERIGRLTSETPDAFFDKDGDFTDAYYEAETRLRNELVGDWLERQYPAHTNVTDLYGASPEEQAAAFEAGLKHIGAAYRVEYSASSRSQYFYVENPITGETDKIRFATHQRQAHDADEAHLNINSEGGAHSHTWQDAQEYLEALLENKTLAQSAKPFEGNETAKTPLPEGTTTIEVDGKQRPALNSNGKPIHPTLEGVRNFWRWFGDSKVVDAEGRPLVVYHGTDKDFSTFDNKKLGESTGAKSAALGHFFTNRKDVAESYANYAALDAPVKRALDDADKAEAKGDWDAYDEHVVRAENLEAEIADEIRRGQNIVPAYLRISKADEMDAKGEMFSALDGAITKRIQTAVRTEKDGVIIRNLDDSAGHVDRVADHFVVFNPEQIKSATGNTGDFNPNDANILHQKEQTGNRGFYEPDSRTIGLLQNADLSTYIHETGHWALDLYSKLAAEENAPPKIREDMDKLLKWFGVESLEKWNSMHIDAQRPYHEQLARGFEAYLMEGKAPTTELQPVFSRVKSWMLNIYKTLRGLNVQLTDEVRSVFDRMLASEEAIKEAEQARSYAAMISEKPAHVSDEDWAKYKAMGEEATQEAIDSMQARSMRDMKWLSNAKSKAIKELQAQANTERKAIREEVAQQVDEMPVYKMQMEGDTQDMNVLAEKYGFPSAEAAEKALREAEPREQVIEGLTDRYMLERHGELATPEAIEQAAHEAIHNEARARMMATGLKMIAKSPVSARQLEKGAREAAEAVINSRRVRDIKPKQYEAAEAKAIKDVVARAAKDPQGAVSAQRSALLNNQLVRASQSALTEVQKAVDYFKRLEKQSAQNNMRGEFLEQLNELLGRFDLRTSVGNPAKDRKPLGEWVASEAERLSAVMPDLPEWVLNEGYRTHYTELTMEQMRGLRDSVRQLEFLARREQKQYMAIRAMAFAEERGEILTEIRKNWAKAFDEEGQPKEMEPDFVPSLKKAKAKLGDKFAGEFLTPETILSILGGGKFTVVNESLFGRLSNRSDWKAQRLEKLYKEMKPLFDQYSVKEKYDFARKDIGTDTVGIPLTRENAVVVALLHGNADGRERLKNYGWSEAKQQDIINQLEGKDLDLIDGIHKVFDENLWPELKELNERTRGKAPPKVEAMPYRVNGRDMKGGYFKLKYDTDLDERAHRLDEGQAVKELLGGGMGMSAKTNQGSSTERKQNVILRPRLDLGVFAEAVNESVHDLAYREAVADTMRLLNDKGVMLAVKQIVGTEGYRALVNRVREVAAPPRNPSGFIENALSIARRNTVINLMSGVKTALQNFTGLAPAMAEVNPGLLGAEVARFYGPKMMERYEFAMSQSDYMRRRFTSYDRDLQNNVKKLTVKGSFRPDESTFLALMGFIDKGVSVPVWNAAFKQGMERFDNDTKKAIDYADHVVRQTQGSGRDVDLAQVMSGHGGWGQLKKAFTMFYSYFNGQLNLLVKHGVISKLEAQQNPQLAAAKFAAKFIAVVAVPTILTEMLMNSPAQDGEEADHLIKRYAGAFIKYGAGMFPLVRDLTPGFMSVVGLNDKYFGTKLSPLDSAAEGVVKGAEAIKHIATGEDNEHDTKNLIMATGYTLGLPGKLVSDTVEGTKAYMQGDAGPQAIVLGPPKKH